VCESGVGQHRLGLVVVEGGAAITLRLEACDRIVERGAVVAAVTEGYPAAGHNGARDPTYSFAQRVLRDERCGQPRVGVPVDLGQFRDVLQAHFDPVRGRTCSDRRRGKLECARQNIDPYHPRAGQRFGHRHGDEPRAGADTEQHRARLGDELEKPRQAAEVRLHRLIEPPARTTLSEDRLIGLVRP